MKGWSFFPHSILTMLVLVGGHALVLAAVQEPPTFEQSFQILPGGTVEVDNPIGGIQVQTWDETYVHVRAEKISPPGQPVFFSDLTIAASESTIVIGCHPADPQARINLTVYAPRNCQVQVGKGQGAGQTPPPTPSSSQGQGQPPPPASSGTSGRIAGDQSRDYDQSNAGWGPIRKDGDRKGSSEGSMGIGVRVIPPLGTGSDSSSSDRRRTSDRDPFAVFDQDPFFNSTRDPFGKSKRESSTNTDMGLPSPDRDRSARRRSEPVLRSRRDSDRADAGAVSRSSGEASSRTPSDTLVLQGDLVNLNASVRDRSGKAVTGLTQSSFQVYEDDVLQQIAFFSPTSAPFNLVLMLDLSGSMREKVDVLKEAAIRFIAALNPEDRVAVVTFTHEVRIISPLTQDRALLRERIQQIEGSRGRTALYEALWQVVGEVFQDIRGQRNAIVLLSDGVDNSISEFNAVPTVVSFDDLLNRIEESDIIIYPIYLDTEQEVVYKYLQESPETYAMARERLQLMAEVTGGLMFRAQKVEDLDKTYGQVASELRTVYSLGYYPGNNRHDGSWRRVRVKVKGKNAVVRTRTGYSAR
ncbi:MAG: VWA domain-containing protein [Acidobacteria bacterium]|nr:VWA domain-containing protein [Acidobacteriota bacterium]